MPKTVVILGAGLAGVPLAHYLASRTDAQIPDLRVVLVSPNSHFYWNLASVRFALPSDKHAMTEDKYLISLADKFAKYPKDKFEFVSGAATQLHPDRNVVTIALNDGGNEIEIAYHTLVVATGSSYAGGMPWKGVGTTEATRAAIAQLRTQIQNAKSIVVAGAGATGVEFAGELGAAYAKKGAKKVTIVSTDPLPLESRLQDKVRATAKKELEKLKVEVLTNARVVSSNGKEIEIEQKGSGKKTLTADLLIPTYGAKPNTSFAPASMLSPSSPGRLRQGPDLRVPGHSNIFVVGDAGDLQPLQAVYAEQQARHLMEQFASYFATDGKTVAPYKVDDKVMFGVTIGPDRGTGQMGNFQPPSLLIWWFKGKYIGTNYSADWAAGIRSSNGAFPK
ncbi:FAD/NAD(P)-binding domain-containing protein [Hypomontagnella submonticulosa]|nr:FAD/NAD(P)-binding domain-containing protein [Hypomontagnella submonticulosa]